MLIYGAALAFVVRSVAGRLRRRRGHEVAKAGRALRRVRIVVYVLAGLGVLCGLYARLVEPFWPEVTHVQVHSAKLPPGSRPIRIRVVHISDIHADPEARLEPRLPALIAAEAPDLIVYTGDSLNAPGGLDNFRTLMTRLAAIAPTYAVRGNWDVWLWGDIDLFGGTGVIELDGTAARVPSSLPVDVFVAGAAAGSPERIATALAAVPPGAISILLYHYPDEILEVARLAHGADLYCAGHTHGGQVGLPLYGAMVTLSRFGKRYESGLHREGSTWLHVNRGIGMEGGHAPRVRFMARPEVTVIDITP